MVLVDTSVWIRFLQNRAPYAAGLEALLSLDEVAGHHMIHGELLIGDCGGRQALLTAYERMHQAAVVPHEEVVTFVRHRKLRGRGLSWIDVQVLASALVGRLQIWTADIPFREVVREFGIAHDPPRPS